MITRRNCLQAIAAAGLSACLAAASLAQAPSFDQLREVRIEVRGDAKTHVFRAWVADTPQARARGLMYVRELPPDRAMLFRYELPQFASFWMKNTYIPLDLIFVAPDGRIVNIIENARPLSLAPLESTAPVTQVLEVAGGTAARLGIRPGHTLETVQAARDD
jgi:uncharacterized membrane protein (UPF0127 family)